MEKLNLKKILGCPNCKKELGLHRRGCKLRNRTFKNVDGIWDFSSERDSAQRQNELMHREGSWGRISDGSYEILAAFARGNKTIDIACGEGWIEQLALDTVGVDFSMAALRKAQKNGAKYLVCANAQSLPFIDDAFDLAICAGSLENIAKPQKTIREMARVSKIQIMTVHREFNIPTIRTARTILSKLFNIKHQAVEYPLKWNELEKMFSAAKLKIVFKGFWTLPINYGKPIKFLPVLTKIPSCFLAITCRESFD